MTFFEILFIGIALSMDAAAVSMTNGMVYKNISVAKKITIPLFFGGFQAIMSLIGFFIGAFFVKYVSDYSGYLVFLILLLLGCKMLYDAVSEIIHPKQTQVKKVFTYPLLILQSIATSIDALAIGVMLSTTSNVNIFYAAVIIGITTVIFSFFSLMIGRKFGDILGSKAQILGGAILIIISIKTLLETL